jgi:tetratricopeptide (TPR) repeat protein
MSAPSAPNFRKAAIRLVATGIGAVAAGPLGAILGASLGGVFSEEAARLIEPYLHSGAERLSEFGVHYCFEKFREMQSHPPLEEVATQALRLALEQVRNGLDASQQAAFGDWFTNWNWSLNGGLKSFDSLADLIRQTSAGAPRASAELQAETLDGLFQKAMERLDGEARAHAQKGARRLSIGPQSFRPIPAPLVDLLAARLPAPLRSNFEVLIARPEHHGAWVSVQQIFHNQVRAGFAKLDSTTVRTEAKVDRILEIQERELRRAVEAKEVAEQEVRRIRGQNQEYKEKYERLEADVASRAQDPAEKQFANLLSSGDLEAAAQLKAAQIERQQGYVKQLARSYAELGQVHDLRFAWREALDSYREAWRLDPKEPDYGFQFAYFALKQNRFEEAIQAYNDVLPLCTEPDKTAYTLSNLGVLYGAAQRTEKAAHCYREALATYRSLAESDPRAHLPYVAMTLNNLANLYCDMQRVQEAEQCYQEALGIRRNLAEANPEAYLPDVAMTLNNLAILYRATERMKKAEQRHGEALDIYRNLAQTNPEAHLHDVAMTLNNLAILYKATERMKKAEQAYQEALAILRKLGQAHPEAYFPDVAMTLYNLAILYDRMQLEYQAEGTCAEAHDILEPFSKINPALHGNNLARIDLLGAMLCSERAEDACRFAREALAAARNAALEQQAQELVDRFCPPSDQ